MLNHNLLNKISEQYIQERVNESKKKMYFYLYKDSTSHEINYDCIGYKFIEADNDRECCIKVFDRLSYIYMHFIIEYSGDKVIQKYTHSPEYINLNDEDDEIDEFKFEEQFKEKFITYTSSIFDDNDIKRINDLKYNYINGLIRNIGYSITYREPGSFLMIAKYPGNMV